MDIDVKRRVFLKPKRCVSKGGCILWLGAAYIAYQYAKQRFPVPEYSIEDIRVSDEMFDVVNCLDEVEKEDKIVPEVISEVNIMIKEAETRGVGISESLLRFFYPGRYRVEEEEEVVVQESRPPNSYFAKRKTLKDSDLVAHKLLEHLEKCGTSTEDKIRIIRDFVKSDLNSSSVTLHNRLFDDIIMEKGDMDICCTRIHTKISIDADENLTINTLCDGNVFEGSWRIRKRARKYAFGTSMFTMGLITLYFTTPGTILFAPFLYLAIYKPCMYLIDSAYKAKSKEMGLPKRYIGFDDTIDKKGEQFSNAREPFTLKKGPQGYILSQVSEYPKE